MASLNKGLASVTGYANVIDLLMHEGACIRDLIEETGMSHTTLRKFILCLKRRELLYIRGWAPDSIGRMVLPVYKLGRGNNVPKPIAISQNEKEKRRWAKVKARKNVLSFLQKRNQVSDNGVEAP